MPTTPLREARGGPLDWDFRQEILGKKSNWVNSHGRGPEVPSTGLFFSPVLRADAEMGV